MLFIIIDSDLFYHIFVFCAIQKYFVILDTHCIECMNHLSIQIGFNLSILHLHPVLDSFTGYIYYADFAEQSVKSEIDFFTLL